MGQVSRVLRRSQGGYTHWCPGCQHAHFIATDREAGPKWTFDGNLDAPTFAPSIKIYEPARAEHTDPDGEVWPARPEKTICHYFVQGGAINFCGDCEHEYSGKQGVPLPDLSGAEMANYGWGD